MFEFLLLALITTQEPISVQKYQEMADCQNAASELTAFAESNYTDLKWDAGGACVSHFSVCSSRVF